MAKFEDAIATVLLHEGGFSDNSRDPGGVTNWGVSLRFLKSRGIDVDKDGDVDQEDIRGVSMLQAQEIYKKYFWLPIYERIESQAIATKVFDTAVNIGHRNAHTVLQKALQLSGKGVSIDGQLGEETLAATNDTPMELLLREMRASQAVYYTKVVLNSPPLITFIVGWMRRSVS